MTQSSDFIAQPVPSSTRKKACVPGSFDPITNGHLWVITKAASIFDEVEVIISVNPKKKKDGYFTFAKRAQLIATATAGLSNVKVTVLQKEYIASYCQRNQIEYMVRGIRNSQDMEYERTVQRTNERINPSLQTIHLLPPENLGELSSSLVKSLLGYPKWINIVSGMVPGNVTSEFLNRMYSDKLRHAWNQVSSPFSGQPLNRQEQLVSDSLDRWFDKIVGSYNDQRSARAYHTAQHLTELLVSIDEYRGYSAHFQRSTLTFAVFFHDMVYDSRLGTNEDESVKQWLLFCDELNIGERQRERVKGLISATKSHASQPPGDDLLDLFLDLDLGILGSDPVRFDEYEEQIRMEYAHVNQKDYEIGRSHVMSTFAALGDGLYRTAFGKTKWGEQAAKNLAKYAPPATTVATQGQVK
jgi:pantetheine-phosphate adenylyltransferase